MFPHFIDEDTESKLRGGWDTSLALITSLLFITVHFLHPFSLALTNYYLVFVYILTYLLHCELIEKNWIICKKKRKFVFSHRPAIKANSIFILRTVKDAYFDLEILSSLFYFPFGSGAWFAQYVKELGKHPRIFFCTFISSLTSSSELFSDAFQTIKNWTH